MEVKTREIVGICGGDRSKESFKNERKSLPPVYRQCAVCYTDFWDYYTGKIAKKRHKPVDQKSCLKSLRKRFNNTLKQRVFRLVIKTLFFSKKLDNYIGCVWYFIHYYNSFKLQKT